MKPKIDYSIYLVTDRDLMSTETLEEAVEKSCNWRMYINSIKRKRLFITRLL